MADSRRRTQRRREKQRRRLEWRLLVCNATPAGEKRRRRVHFKTQERKILARCWQEKNTFCKLPYPSKETIGYYLKSTGYGTEAKIVAATEKWGRNVFEYPQPTFQRLMKEQIMEPFLVFQVFCVGLWCLDEYWWNKLSGTELIPGDVVSIGRSTGLDGEYKSVPADMLIIAGSAIVNEAILSGESTP
ncbi:putative manganese-transporting ATPase PDR2 [Sesamum alatum]|uniref:Manganese-transporting ATPase PDR2 n=1 Tax=Sesamum alatum TaxID=300844 RepID=A0AAE2CQI1_9LAMI|nr:putative manganese-transporting ATPase PDR2 [Sesamum alatum]